MNCLLTFSIIFLSLSINKIIQVFWVLKFILNLIEIQNNVYVLVEKFIWRPEIFSGQSFISFWHGSVTVREIIEFCYNFRFVHRLDFATSGALCLALNRQAASHLASAFKKRLVTKYYLALVCSSSIDKNDKKWQKTRIVRESDYSPAAALFMLKKGQVLKILRRNEILTSIKGCYK